MSHKYISVATLAIFSATAAFCQIPLNPTPSRVVGQATLQSSSISPNLVEGRELYNPQGIALDTTLTPPGLYVADTGNNRVLGWRNSASFANGAPADIVIGQPDKVSTLPQGPAGSRSTGLSSPTGLAVRGGNLYVADSGNNRILRFPTPFQQPEIFPDLVIGQTNFNGRSVNYTGQVSARGLSLSPGGAVYRVGLAFDSGANGNLWVVDPGNRRVLRFPNMDRADRLGGFDADVVIGQFDFTSVATALNTGEASTRLVRDRFVTPSAIAFDPQGNLYVTDSDSTNPARLSRILVFRTPLATGMSAARIMGLIVPPAEPTDPPIPQATIDRTVMYDPEGVFFLPGNAGMGVIDSFKNRILIFDVLNQWPAESDTVLSPQAKAIFGHTDYGNIDANNSQPAPSGGTLAIPSAAVMTATELFLVDAGNNRVIVLPYSGGNFSPATRVLGQDRLESNAANLIEGREFQFGVQTSTGTSGDTSIVVDTRSDPPHLYVADPYNNRVLGFRDLRSVRPGDKADLVIGQPNFNTSLCNYPSNDGDRPTQSSLCGPIGLALDDDGNLYVADSRNGRVLRFPNPFARQGTLPQADLVLGQASFTSKITDPSPRFMARPYGLAFVGTAGLAVSDAAHNRVLVFPRVNGTFSNGQAATKVIGQSNFTNTDAGAGDNRLNSPRLLATDSDARLYVADTGNNRVLIFDSFNNLPTSDSRAASQLSGLSGVRGVFVSQRTGEIWVTNTGGGTVQRYVRFDQLQINGRPTVTIPILVGSFSVPPLAVTQDQFGDLFVADAANRVAIFYPGILSLNGASFLESRPQLAPGMVATLKPAGANFGQTFGTDSAVFTDLPRPLPLPRELADVQVTVDGQAAPLYHVFPSQVTFQVPMNAPTSGTVDITVIKRSTGQIFGTSTIPMSVAAPGLFNNGTSTVRQAAILNQDGSANSPSNPAERGSVISIFATGQGFVPGSPADGEAPTAAISTPEKPRVWIGTCYTDDCAEKDETILYSGLAPGLVGVWQINVRVPQATVPGPQIPIFVFYRSITSLDPNPPYRTVLAVQNPVR
jgi:uncharacterized protein (TIGR03437 family)